MESLACRVRCVAVAAFPVSQVQTGSILVRVTGRPGRRGARGLIKTLDPGVVGGGEGGGER